MLAEGARKLLFWWFCGPEPLAKARSVSQTVSGAQAALPPTPNYVPAPEPCSWPSEQ